MAVIELDLDAPSGPEPDRRRWYPARYRTAALAVVLLATLALGGAARPMPQLWRPGGSLPITPQGTFQLLGGRLYTFDRVAGDLTTSAWALNPVRRLWSRDDPVTVTEGVPADFDAFLRAAGDDTALLQVGNDTTVLDAATGTVRWQRAGPVVPITGAYGVAYDETFPTGDEVGGDDNAGTVFYGSDGALHTGPPSHTDVRLVDLATGAVRWTAGFGTGAVAVAVPGRPGAVLLYTRTGFALRDLATGAVLAARTVDLAPDQDTVFGVPMTAGLLLISGTGSATAYAQRTLAPVWTRPRTATDEILGVCGDLPCVQRPGDVTVLDPATGRDRWTIDISASLRRFGPDLYVVENTQARVLEVRDPATGALRADLRRWSATSVPGDQDPVVLSKSEPGGVVFGLLRPYGRIQPLGRSELPVTECQNDARLVVCRTPTGAQTWWYRV